MRARVPVVVTYAIEVSARCLGEPSAVKLPAAGDARNALTTAGVACFRARNRLRPEGSWTSMYELTELQVREQVAHVDTRFPRLVSKLLAASPTPAFCRDDGAFLSGRVGRSNETLAAPAIDEGDLAEALAKTASFGTSSAASIPLTGAFEAEKTLWERCNAPDAKGELVAQERCQLLRQLDRFLADVDSAARLETPKGAPGPSSSSSGASP
jgi:hypothetical protein